MFDVAASNILNYFTGAWRLERRVTDQPLMHGEAQFSPSATQPNHLDFVERLSWPAANGQRIQAQRAYTYRRTDTGLAIDFADGVSTGALFLAFDFDRASELTSHHLCIADHYDGRFVFHSAQAFELSFQVVGPHKDYHIRTRFER
ncbi:DUF6314 family protein [Saccharospirillum mangrovi]|uniref:DUF6314 family protein n=1 Tax=Saccharospirillum mangrovi TaxID=2161747 RepID=UPI000D379A6F|nr:DUF6314 family protein [Saccharospirillum mangrovi]